MRHRAAPSLVLALGIWALHVPPAAAGLYDSLPDRPLADRTTSQGHLVYAYNKQNPRPHEPMPQAPLKPPRSVRRSPDELARRRQRREASALLSQQALAGLTALITLTVAIQWLTVAMRLPAILPAVILGALAGPVSGLINAEALFGNLLLPLVSLSLAVILYEESRNVRFAELRPMRGQPLGLVGTGLLVAGLTGMGAAYLILDLAPPLALLLGIIVAVTGPALGASRVRSDPGDGSFATMLEGEGALLDLVGTLVVVLVFQGILFGTTSYATDALAVMVNTIWMGAVVGLVAAAAAGGLLTVAPVPGLLREPLSLALVTTAFTGAEILQPSSGFLAVIVMGLTLANWKSEQPQFEEQRGRQMRPLLAVGLLILVTARLQSTDLAEIDAAGILFLAIVMIARPLAVTLCPLPSGWTWRRRLLFAALAPRGVMAAGLSTVFGLRLVEAGFGDARSIAPLALLVVVGTAGLHILAVPLLRRWLPSATRSSQPELTGTPQAG